MKNSYDSFKADAKGAIGFVAFVTYVAFMAFYPIAIIAGASKVKEEDRPKYWKRFFCHWMTWLWIACVVFFVCAVYPSWHEMLKR